MALTPTDPDPAAETTHKPAPPTARRAMWRQRGRRTASGASAALAVLCVGALLVMLDYAVYRYLPQRWDVSSLRYYELSEKTLNLLGDVRGNVRLIPVFDTDNPLGDEVRRLLEEYSYAAGQVHGLKLVVEPVDPDRDLARTRELSAHYGLTEPSALIVVVDDRHMLLSEADLVDYERLIDDSELASGRLNIEKKKRGFRGEQVISSAIHSLAQARQPIVYVVTGHGERRIAEFSDPAGYASAARLLRRENTDIRPLMLAEAHAVPADANAVLLAGPTLRLADSEVAALADYLERSGRLLVLLDPGEATGLEALLEKWGVRLARDGVVGMTLTGRELFIREYGSHPIGRALTGLVTMFYESRSVEAIAESDPLRALPADRPRVTALAFTSEGWAESDLRQNPPRFDADVDRKGPISVAVAVERGAATGIDMQLRPTRMVVIGDSDFVSNGALKDSVGANADLLLGSINWLVEREDLLAISAKSPIDLRLDMDDRQARVALEIILLALPGAVAVLGLLVWIARRR